MPANHSDYRCTIPRDRVPVRDTLRIIFLRVKLGIFRRFCCDCVQESSVASRAAEQLRVRQQQSARHPAPLPRHPASRPACRHQPGVAPQPLRRPPSLPQVQPRRPELGPDQPLNRLNPIPKRPGLRHRARSPARLAASRSRLELLFLFLQFR